MAIALVVLGSLVVVWGVGSFVRAAVVITRADDGDRARALLASACARLPADRVEWGQAMLAELACVEGSAARWRFALGGARAAATARVMDRVTGRPSFTLVVTGALVGEGLVIAALVDYPALRADPLIPAFLAVVTVVLIAYAAIARIQVGDPGTDASRARRYGLWTGPVVGLAWLVFAVAWWNLHGVPLIIAVLVPVVAGVLGARLPGGRRSGIRSVVWTGLVAGLVAFLGFAVDAFATAGGPYVPAQLDEFLASGSTDAAAYWLGEGLVGALFLLVVVPCLTLIAGGLGAAVIRPVRAGR